MARIEGNPRAFVLGTASRHSPAPQASPAQCAARLTGLPASSPSTASQTPCPGEEIRSKGIGEGLARTAVITLPISPTHSTSPWLPPPSRDKKPPDLIVQIAMDRQLGLRLPLEESVVQLLVVDINFAHLGTNFLSHLGFHGLLFFLENYKENPTKVFHSLAEPLHS